MFTDMFPKILDAILSYTNSKQKQISKETLLEINNKLLQLVLKIMKNKNDFREIF